ncbi:HAMP domain-containing methyl-accepting chemotaxis protein [Bradyrhizobium sp. CIAT3101]|uniref:methyl-accepting chemotaxis protein n=1 Tax=Bradyrhizobium sp. CIAT3101 TaxID=439387 RepID=UPI0024B0B4D8|nr:HAMP domain-containing methyl-accepting chemotaxis protein [Bradyrhizobium sp. CIAT3101]WFU80478.1 HAMP domain-containing methyl-accepting chemotaxis protein [Bradyrhizobium sp. CIAT3101]
MVDISPSSRFERADQKRSGNEHGLNSILMRASIIAIRLILPILRRLRPSLRTEIAMLGIGGVLVTGAMSVLGLDYIAQVQREADRSIHLRAHLAAISEAFLESQQLALEFLRKHNEALITRQAQSLSKELVGLDQIEEYVAPLPEGDPLKDVSFLRAGIGLYATRFNNIVSAQRVLGFAENDGLQGKLREAVHQAESRLTLIDQPQLTVLMLKMRRHEKDFMLRREEKYGDELDKRVAEFQATLAASELAPSAKAELKSLIESYRSSFVAFLVAQQALDDQVDDLGQIYGRNRPLLLKAMATADARAVAAEERASRIRQMLGVGIGLATLVIGFVAIVVGQTVARLITRMTKAMRQLAAGQFEVTLPGLGRSDEIGEMAQAMEAFKLKSKETAQAEFAANLEQDRLAGMRRKEELEKLAKIFEDAVSGVIDTLSSASTELEASARSLTDTAHNTQEFSGKVAFASEEASGNVQVVAARTAEMMASATEVERQVEQSAVIARGAVRQAEETNRRIKHLLAAALKIGGVVELIAAIARQTNLLALNATIEAEHAGRAGRGFAVVAHEVKSLATQTAKATSQIAEQIAGIQAATEESVSAIAEVGNSIGRISQIVSTIAAATEAQGTATKDIAQNIQHAAQMSTQIAGTIRQVALSASSTGASSSQVLTSANALAQSSHRLKLEVDGFLAGVRS